MTRPDHVQPAAGAGLLVSFEGLDGVGKTTQINALEYALTDSGYDVVRLREPGGTPLGENIRQLLLHGKSYICSTAELLLFEAARAELVHDVITPALDRGAVVLCDRFFDSTTAYQGYGRNVSIDTVESANRIACGDVKPEITVLFDMDPQEAILRATKDGADRMEQEGLSFRSQVRRGFLDIAASNPSRVFVVDASGTPEQVWNRLRLALAGHFDLPQDMPVVEEG